MNDNLLALMAFSPLLILAILLVIPYFQVRQVMQGALLGGWFVYRA
ncbi:MAG TPA: hypothetical protein VIC51_13190 [Psychromonas sp.]